MKRIFRWATVWALVWVFSFGLFTSCSRSKVNVPAGTGKTMTAAEMAPGIRGDTVYAQMNSAWVKQYHEVWWSEMFDKGAKYDPRFDCNKFAGKFLHDADFQYYSDNFQSWTNARAVGMSV